MSAANGKSGKRSWDESPISCISYDTYRSELVIGDESPISCIAYDTYRSELVICDDVVELEDFSGACTSDFSIVDVDVDGWLVVVWTTDEEGAMILWPCNAWINSSESSSVFDSDGSRNPIDGTFSISVIADVYYKTRS